MTKANNAQTSPATPPTARQTLFLLLPALIVGIACSLILIATMLLASQLDHFWWLWLPQTIGIHTDNPWWIFTILSLTGVLVGLTVWLVPGHAGSDPATVSLIDKPLPVKVVPGLLLAVILMLAGGVSLGPENPIIAANAAFIAYIGTRLLPKTPATVWVGFAASGTIGALFGTPLAAALLLSEAAARKAPHELWDQLIAPLTAAGAGALTTKLLGGLDLSLNLPAYEGFQFIDLISGSLIAFFSALIGLLAIYIFPWAHHAFARLRHPFVMIVAGGILLGVLGMLGGKVTLFKGLDEMKLISAHLSSHTSDITTANLFAIAGIKLIATIISATCGFRGGRIFPSLFVGAVLGLAIHTAFPAIPPALAVASSSLGILLIVTRQGWLAFFTAMIIVPNMSLLPVLCLIMLPAWLLAMGKPQMIVAKEKTFKQD